MYNVFTWKCTLAIYEIIQDDGLVGGFKFILDFLVGL